MKWRDKKNSKNVEDRTGDTRTKQELDKLELEKQKRELEIWKRQKEKEWGEGKQDKISLDDFLSREFEKEQARKETEQQNEIDNNMSLDEYLEDLSKRSRLFNALEEKTDTPLLPQKGPERVDSDPNYNPFNRDKNGFEDLEGEVHIWKKDPVKKDQFIREAGREKDFSLDINYDSSGRPLPKKGPERVKRDPDYNPFDVAQNGEEDLEGEAFIWKTDPLKKNRLIQQAGRASFFGLEGDTA